MRRIDPFWSGIICLSLAGCLDRKADQAVPPPAQQVAKPAQPGAELRDEIPADQLTRVINAHYRGAGAMERYEYRAAADAFREINRLAPGWITGTINLSIALLNLGGEAAEKAKKTGEGDSAEAVQNIESARQLLDGIITRQPSNPFALFSRGIILQSQGELIAAHRDFARVTEIDPNDASAWLEYGESLTDPDREGMPAGKAQAPELIAAYSNALKANPYLVTAMFRLQEAYNRAGDRAHAVAAFESFKKLNTQFDPAAAGEKFALVYGEMGKYAQIIDPFRRPESPQAPLFLPQFGSLDEIEITLAAGDRWAKTEDFVGRSAVIGRAQRRFGAGIVTYDVNRDGRLDLYLTAAVVGPHGLHDVLLVNQGNRTFTDQTARYGLPLDRASLGVAAGDFDADFQVDLYLTGIGDNRLLRLVGEHYQDITREAGVAVDQAISLTARWLDIDQDGDLDLYVINHAAIADMESVFTANPTGGGVVNAVFRNDGRPAAISTRPDDNLAPLATATADLQAQTGLSLAFTTTWPAAEILQASPTRHSALAALDIDNDRDIDLVVTADDAPIQVLLNDRAGLFHAAPIQGWADDSGILSGLLVTHAEKDGRPDLVATRPMGSAFVWQNQTERAESTGAITGKSFPTNARNWRSATTTDLDLDTWSDLIGLPELGARTGAEWARNSGLRFANQALPLGPIGTETPPWSGLTVADLVGSPLVDIVCRRDGEAPRIAENRGNGQHWLALNLAGRWKRSHDQMRTNSEGLGARVALEGQGLYVPFDYTTPEAGPGQSVAPFVLGLGSQLNVPLLRMRWPDGVMQSELNVVADKVLHLVELNRKTGSCPILFTWNGTRFVCIGDFAGAAGLGFLESPGEYHPPDRDEALVIQADQLHEIDGHFRLSVVEPMDEIAYLDHLTLEVVDRPPGTEMAVDERFAFGTDHPTGETLVWTQTFFPAAATDHQGCDVLDLVARADRRTVDQFRKLEGWVGYTEDHALILDFRSSRTSLKESADLILGLVGWVEYPYSQTNYAAAHANVKLQAPILEQQLVNGNWQVIDPAMGHPAGLPRLMTLSLKDKLISGAPLIFRIRTNMECYWDQAFLAVPDASTRQRLRTIQLPVARAELGDRGYLREVAPDGLNPPLPDYAQVAPMPLARFRGELTRQGDVASLLRKDDDHLCVIGPGDAVELEFDAAGLPPLESGWSRSFVLRSIAYCKDADPFTATSDSVGPLPWRGMKSFPLPVGGDRPIDAAYADYLRTYQTRPAGER